MEQLRQLTKLNFTEVPDPRGQSAPDTPRAAVGDLGDFLTEAEADLLYEPLGGGGGGSTLIIDGGNASNSGTPYLVIDGGSA